MGQSACAGQRHVQARLVESLGIREREAISYDSEDSRQSNHVLKCPDGHVMKGWIVREMFAMCAGSIVCAECETEFESDRSCYRCKTCDVYYCNHCSRRKLNLPPRHGTDEPMDIMMGDIFFAGPDVFGIHHVILCRSGWKTPEPEVYEAMDLEPGTNLLSCETIESTQGSVGDKTWWYPATTYFAMDEQDGTMRLVGDLKEGSECIQQAIEPVPTKVLLHPLREGAEHRESLDEEVFESVIQARAERSKQYGKLTAVRSVISGITLNEAINAEGLTLKKDKQKLLKKIRKSWEYPPICASVAVKCWQDYLLQTAASELEGVDEILNYIPMWCHKSTPSAMVKEMTQRGWVLCDTFDG